ncbi:50S ribosomal protein L3, putative [Eimeria necatrix]|uniref:Large ribosomal subunit protein uL3c n=1 Tax=Eimeria necatrix TaxID=51315 RepID=U6N0W9_9EIME|nr:50S ribosomal protein L3, putative [Eimeria necatrix]CDJ68968.1 50S ribosomal protein L3, putative [Eimeria necatrix]
MGHFKCGWQKPNLVFVLGQVLFFLLPTVFTDRGSSAASARSSVLANCSQRVTLEYGSTRPSAFLLWAQHSPCLGTVGLLAASHQREQEEHWKFYGGPCATRRCPRRGSSGRSGETRLWARKFLNLRDPEEPRPELQDLRWKDSEPKVEILALKVGMTSVFASDGTTEPATLLQVLPATIVQFLEHGKALVAYDDPLHSHRFLRRSVLGVLQRVGSSGSGTSTAGSSSRNSISNSSLAAISAQPAADYVLGQILDVSALVGAARVNVKGRPKKKGFEGVMQRHGFKGGPATHGSKHHRGPGSIGAGTDPGRVLPGSRMAGRDPKKTSTVRDLLLLGINIKNNSLLVRGAVPGHSGKTVLRIQWNRAREQQLELRRRLDEAVAEEFLQHKKGRPI